MKQEVKTAAIDVIKSNDHGNYTVPTSGLYPFQWNWDSGFTALGYACFDFPRAWLEIQTLLAGQWESGMIPHILFWQDDKGYFPNKDVWNSNTIPASSGYSQPPVLSSIVLSLVKLGQEKDQENAASLVNKLFNYHRWFHVNRDPEQTGLVATFHPWETGRDNCPEWDEGLQAVEVDESMQYERRDLDHVDASNRPTKWYYDRFITLLEFGRQLRWDDAKIYQQSPFLYCDVGIQFILMRAGQDLIELINLLDANNKLTRSYAEEINQLNTWLAKSQDAVDSLFSEQTNTYSSLNLKNNQLTSKFSNASALAWYAKLHNKDNLAKLKITLNGVLDDVEFFVPSWQPNDEKFEAKRYWRGPVWAIMNYMIAKGLKEHNENELANQINQNTLDLIEKTGFCEYYDPLTAEGLGGSSFSWTAAIYLTLLSEQEKL